MMTRVAPPGAETIRVLSVIPGGAEGCSFIFARRQVASLGALGVDCKTFFLPSLMSATRFARCWRQFRREVRAFRPHLVHAHWGMWCALFSTLATNLPFVVTYSGSDLNPNPDQGRLKWAAYILFSQIAALRARRIICLSDELKSRLWWGRGRATVITQGVDTELFAPRCRQKAREGLGWRRDELVVLFNAARYRRVKRMDLARAAVDVARAICGEVRLAVLDGSVDPDEVPTFMNASDCLLVTSDWEGGPNVVKEALACNLPVVSVDVGEVRERLAGVQPSKVVERDPESIGRALADILMKRSRSNGREAIQHLTLGRVAARVVAVYREALRPGRASAAGSTPPSAPVKVP